MDLKNIFWTRNTTQKSIQPLNSNFGICTQCIKYDSYVSPGLLGCIPVRKKSESALLVFMLLGFLIKIMAYFQFMVIRRVDLKRFAHSALNMTLMFEPVFLVFMLWSFLIKVLACLLISGHTKNKCIGPSKGTKCFDSENKAFDL